MEGAACREGKYEWDGSCNAIVGGRMPVAGEGHWVPDTPDTEVDQFKR